MRLVHVYLPCKKNAAGLVNLQTALRRLFCKAAEYRTKIVRITFLQEIVKMT